MSFVRIVPKTLAAAANLRGIGAAMSAQNTAAAAQTTGLVAAAAGRGIGADRNTIRRAHPDAPGGKCPSGAASIHQMFVTMLTVSAGSLAATEAANARAAR